LLEKPTIETILDEKRIDDLYEKFVISLIRSYMSLKKYYLFIVNKLLDEKIKAEYSNFIVSDIGLKYNINYFKLFY